jgi:phosphohistidine phosphatase
MRVYLVHHADAVGPHVDPQRPLSELGRRQADWVAAAIRDTGFQPAAIGHSGKLRSRQTAEACLRAANPFAQFRMIRGLQPDDPPEWLRDELVAESRDVLLAGHMPNIARLCALLSPGCAPFPLHGAVGLERSEGAPGLEPSEGRPGRQTRATWTEIARFAPSDRS